MRKTILFVAMPNSIHTARWLNQLNDQDWDIHLFPSTLIPVLHPQLRRLTVHYLLHSERVLEVITPQHPVIHWIVRAAYSLLRRGFNRVLLPWRAKRLAKIIAKVQPDIIHSMEMQAAGYLTLMAKELTNNQFPPWIMGVWGNDIYWFGRFPDHQDRIRQVLAHCDYLFCDCQRDVPLARKFGFNKTALPPYPAAGGFDLPGLLPLRNKIKSSHRKIIALKGYQHWAGRALMGLQALQQCTDVLQGFEIHIYGATDCVVKAARLFSRETGISTYILPNGSPYTDILTLHANARVSIGLSMSDGLPGSLLEAMVLGSLPIQSCTACADEWIEHGVSGAIVPPEEPDVVAMWLRKALTDDDWVNQAAELNWQTALARLDGEMLAKQAVAMYSMESV